MDAHPSAARLVRLAERSARYELLSLGVDPGVLDEIETWLGKQGKTMRSDPAPIEMALTRAIAHIEALLNGDPGEACLPAFLELPELRRSLGAHALTNRRRLTQ